MEEGACGCDSNDGICKALSEQEAMVDGIERMASELRAPLLAIHEMPHA